MSSKDNLRRRKKREQEALAKKRAKEMAKQQQLKEAEKAKRADVAKADSNSAEEDSGDGGSEVEAAKRSSKAAKGTKGKGKPKRVIPEDDSSDDEEKDDDEKVSGGGGEDEMDEEVVEEPTKSGGAAESQQDIASPIPRKLPPSTSQKDSEVTAFLNLFKKDSFSWIAANAMVLWGATEKNNAHLRVVWTKERGRYLKVNWMEGLSEFVKFLHTPCCVDVGEKRAGDYSIKDPLFELWGYAAKENSEEMTQVRVGDYIALVLLCSRAYDRPINQFASVIFMKHSSDEGNDAMWVHLDTQSLCFLCTLVTSHGRLASSRVPNTPTKTKRKAAADKLKKFFLKQFSETASNKVDVSVGSARFEPPQDAVVAGNDSDKVCQVTITSMQEAEGVKWEGKEAGNNGAIAFSTQISPNWLTVSLLSAMQVLRIPEEDLPRMPMGEPKSADPAGKSQGGAYIPSWLSQPGGLNNRSVNAEDRIVANGLLSGFSTEVDKDLMNGQFAIHPYRCKQFGSAEGGAMEAEAKDLAIRNCVTPVYLPGVMGANPVDRNYPCFIDYPSVDAFAQVFWGKPLGDLVDFDEISFQTDDCHLSQHWRAHYGFAVLLGKLSSLLVASDYSALAALGSAILERSFGECFGKFTPFLLDGVTDECAFLRCKVIMLAAQPIRIGTLDGGARLTALTHMLLGRYPSKGAQDLLDVTSNPHGKTPMFHRICKTPVNCLYFFGFPHSLDQFPARSIRPETLKHLNRLSHQLQTATDLSTARSVTDALLEVLNGMQGEDFDYIQPAVFDCVTNKAQVPPKAVLESRYYSEDPKLSFLYKYEIMHRRCFVERFLERLIELGEDIPFIDNLDKQLSAAPDRGNGDTVLENLLNQWDQQRPKWQSRNRFFNMVACLVDSMYYCSSDDHNLDLIRNCLVRAPGAAVKLGMDRSRHWTCSFQYRITKSSNALETYQFTRLSVKEQKEEKHVPLVTNSLEVDIESFDRNSQEGFLLSIYLPALVIGNAYHVCMDRFFRPSVQKKANPYWNGYFQRSAVQMFLGLYRDHGYFIPVPGGDFKEKFPRLHRLMVTDMLVCPREEGGDTFNRPPTNLCNLAAILAFCMGRQYHLYRAALKGSQDLSRHMKKRKASEVEIFEEVYNEYSEELQRRFLLLPSKSAQSDILNKAWVETDKKMTVASMVGPALQKTSRKDVPSAFFEKLGAFSLRVWAVPSDELKNNADWNAPQEMKTYLPRSEEEMRTGRQKPVPMDREHIYTLEQIVHGIFVENDGNFDDVAECIDDHLKHFIVDEHFGFYWHHSDPSLKLRKPSECLSPGVKAAHYFVEAHKWKENDEYYEDTDPPDDCGGFFPSFLFAINDAAAEEKKRQLPEDEKKKAEKEAKKAKKNDKPAKKTPSKKGKPAKKAAPKKASQKVPASFDDVVDEELNTLVESVLKLQPDEAALLSDVYHQAYEYQLGDGYLASQPEEADALDLEEECMDVAVTTLMHCYLEKAMKCVRLLPTLPDHKGGLATDGQKLASEVRREFLKEEDMKKKFATPARFQQLVDEMTKIEEEALEEGVYVGGEMARETVPYALAFKLGHSSEAGEKEAEWTDDAVIEYFRHLSIDNEVGYSLVTTAEKTEDDPPAEPDST